jgi:DNA topoisomerase IA
MRSQAKPITHDARDPSAAFTEAMASQVRQAILDAIVRIGSGDESADRAALTVQRAHAPIAPARLARAHPGDAAVREEARQLYERCLVHYRSVVRAQDQALAVDDVGAAVAAFVAASLGALHGTPVTPGMLLSLEKQLDGIARLSSDWETAAVVERQAYFEQMALLAVLVAESAAQAGAQGGAAVANVQRAARGYLRQLLGIDPDHLALGPDGLAARAPAASTSAAID